MYAYSQTCWNAHVKSKRYSRIYMRWWHEHWTYIYTYLKIQFTFFFITHQTCIGTHTYIQAQVHQTFCAWRDYYGNVFPLLQKWEITKKVWSTFSKILLYAACMNISNNNRHPQYKCIQRIPFSSSVIPSVLHHHKIVAKLYFLMCCSSSSLLLSLFLYIYRYAIAIHYVRWPILYHFSSFSVSSSTLSLSLFGASHVRYVVAHKWAHLPK